MIIKVFRKKLADCFDKWKQKDQKKRRKKKMMVQEIIEQDNKEMESEIQKVKEK